MKLKKKQKETILLPTNADINDEEFGPSAVRRITNKRIPSPGGRERHKEPLAGNGLRAGTYAVRLRGTL